MAYRVTFHPTLSGYTSQATQKEIRADSVIPEDEFFEFRRDGKTVAYISAKSILSVEVINGE